MHLLKCPSQGGHMLSTYLRAPLHRSASYNFDLLVIHFVADFVESNLLIHSDTGLFLNIFL